MAIPSFIAIPDSVLRREDLTPADKLVYGSMLSYQGIHYHCFASLDKIASRVGVNEKTARRAIKALLKADVIEPVLVRSESNGKVIQFQQRGGGLGGKTKSWRCKMLLPQKRKSLHLVSSPRSAG